MKEYFKFLGIFFTIVFLFFSISIVLVNAGVLDFKVLVNNDGIHGSKIIVSWFQGDDTLNLGPDQCGFNNIPGDDVPYAFKNSDSSNYPNTDSDPTGCNYCGGNTACNEGLATGVEDYYCDSKGVCRQCTGACSSSSDCGTGYDCDLSSGRCNAACVCDPATCSGSECNGKVETVYDGCSNNVCTSHTVTYDCDGCQNTQTVQVTYKACGCQSNINKCEVCPDTKTANICPGDPTPNYDECSTDGDCANPQN